MPLTLEIQTADRPVFIISDLHLGPKSELGLSARRTAELRALLDTCAEEGALVLLAGDILDTLQTGAGPQEILDRAQLSDCLRSACVATQVVYIIGNHDPGPEELDFLPWEVCDQVIVDGHVLVLHGHHFDSLSRGRRHTRWERAHAFAQNVLGTTIGFPIARHNTLINRAFISLASCLCEVALVLGAVFGPHRAVQQLRKDLAYFIHADQQSDPCRMLHGLSEWPLETGIDTVVCGHSHAPGEIRLGSIRYANCGSWMQARTVGVLRDGSFQVVDLDTGARIGSEAYEGWEREFDWLYEWRNNCSAIRPSAVLWDLLLRILPCRSFGAPRARLAEIADGRPVLDED